jgi:hypothetical protein
MNQGDRIRITIKDTSAGLITMIEDLTTSQTGFMVASAANGFQSLNPNTCAPTNFSFHPEYDTAKFGNFVSWAALQANINFAMEIGHFTRAQWRQRCRRCTVFPGADGRRLQRPGQRF